ncbi:MAG TPA: S1/P1 nuclease [Acidobacteriota bacterium]
MFLVSLAMSPAMALAPPSGAEEIDAPDGAIAAVGAVRPGDGGTSGRNVGPGRVGAAGVAGTVPWAAASHQIVCEIAFRRLTDAGRELVATVMADDPEPAPAFYESCVWADSSRYGGHQSTYEYHFMNVVVAGADQIVMERDCAAFDCVQVAVARYARYLAADPAGNGALRERRAAALKFLGHFVGDLHQPLHVGYAYDRGGNDTRVRFFDDPEMRSLHSVWDFYIPDRMGLHADALASAERLDGEISAADAAAWGTFDIVGWSRESYEMVKGLVYDFPIDSRIGDDYFDGAVPVVERRLQQAGVRLALLINHIAAGTLELPPLFD